MAENTDKREKLAQFAGERTPRPCQFCGVLTINWQEHHFDYERHPNTTVTLCLKCHSLADERRRERELYSGHKKIDLPPIESLVTKGLWKREIVPTSEMMNGINGEIEKLVIDRTLRPQDTLQIIFLEEPFKCTLATKYRDPYHNYKTISINLNETGKEQIKIEYSKNDPKTRSQFVYSSSRDRKSVDPLLLQSMENPLDFSKSDNPLIMELVNEFKLREPKRALRASGGKWYPKNENSLINDCEICGYEIRLFGFYRIKISPEFTIRLCENCKEEFFS